MAGNKLGHDNLPAVCLVTPGHQLFQGIHEVMELPVHHGGRGAGNDLQIAPGIEFTDKILDERLVVLVEGIQAQFNGKLHGKLSLLKSL